MLIPCSILVYQVFTVVLWLCKLGEFVNDGPKSHPIKYFNHGKTTELINLIILNWPAKSNKSYYR